MKVLHVGCGQNRPQKLHPVFRSWQEVRLDIDPRVKPDILADIASMKDVDSQAYDGIWCSHCLEHLDDHKVDAALAEFVRVLNETGFALITAPDLEAAAALIVEGREDEVLYSSPAGDVRTIDMVFGHAKAIGNGNSFMRHNTGFTRGRLGRRMQAAGFSETRVVRGATFDLWALGIRDGTRSDAVISSLKPFSLNFG